MAQVGLLVPLVRDHQAAGEVSAAESNGDNEALADEQAEDAEPLGRMRWLCRHVGSFTSLVWNLVSVAMVAVGVVGWDALQQQETALTRFVPVFWFCAVSELLSVLVALRSVYLTTDHQDQRTWVLAVRVFIYYVYFCFLHPLIVLNLIYNQYEPGNFLHRDTGNLLENLGGYRLVQGFATFLVVENLLLLCCGGVVGFVSVVHFLILTTAQGRREARTLQQVERGIDPVTGRMLQEELEEHSRVQTFAATLQQRASSLLHGEQKEEQEDYEKEEQQKEKEETCIICLRAYHLDDEVRQLDCQHQFHRECVDEWVTSGHADCPVCRHSLQ